ncbi:hypothetical protein YC2023_030187 [Brassica napus]
MRDTKGYCEKLNFGNYFDESNIKHRIKRRYEKTSKIDTNQHKVTNRQAKNESLIKRIKDQILDVLAPHHWLGKRVVFRMSEKNHSFSRATEKKRRDAIRKGIEEAIRERLC